MDNRKLLWLNVALFILGIYLSIQFFYSEEPNLFYGAFSYLIAGALFFVSTFLFKNISSNIRLMNSVMITLYMLHGILMALICFYASPTDHFELTVSLYFFLGAMLAGSTLSYQKKVLPDKVKVLGFHKVVRLTFFVIVALLVLRMVYTIVMTGIALGELHV